MFFETSCPKIGGVLIKTFSKLSFTHFFEECLRGGGFTRRGTNYLRTPLLHQFPKSKSLDFEGMFLRFRSP